MTRMIQTNSFDKVIMLGTFKLMTINRNLCHFAN